MDEKLLNQIAESVKVIARTVKVSEDKVKEAFNEAMLFVNEQFGTADDTTKMNKALLIAVNTFKASSGGSSNNFKGIVLGVTDLQDDNKYKRDSQLKVYLDIKKQAEENGDMSVLESIYNKVVKAEDNVMLTDDKGLPILLHPYLKNDNTVSAMAGKAIPTTEESLVRTVYGMAYAEGTNPEEDLKTFSMKIRGKALNNIAVFGKPVSFQAGSRIYKEEYQLNSGVTDFIEIEDEYLQNGLDNVGIDGMVEKIMGNKIVTYDKLGEWIEQYKVQMSNDIIPRDLKFSFVVIPNVNCMSQNFNVNDKGKINMIFCNDKFDINNTFDIITGTKPEIGEKVEFAQNSSCSIIGQLSIFGEQESPVAYLNLFGAIGKKGLTVPRIDAKPLGVEAVPESDELDAEISNDI